jgi:putative modified peptide
MANPLSLCLGGFTPLDYATFKQTWGIYRAGQNLVRLHQPWTNWRNDMTDSVLNREYGMALMLRLSNDDDFRVRYAAKPAAAMAELGVPLETIVNLKPPCLAATKLAEKSVYAEAYLSLQASGASACVDFHPPNHRLDFGARSGENILDAHASLRKESSKIEPAPLSRTH